MKTPKADRKPTASQKRNMMIEEMHDHLKASKEHHEQALALRAKIESYDVVLLDLDPNHVVYGFSNYASGPLLIEGSATRQPAEAVTTEIEKTADVAKPSKTASAPKKMGRPRKEAAAAPVAKLSKPSTRKSKAIAPEAISAAADLKSVADSTPETPVAPPQVAEAQSDVVSIKATGRKGVKSKAAAVATPAPKPTSKAALRAAAKAAEKTAETSAPTKVAAEKDVDPAELAAREAVNKFLEGTQSKDELENILRGSTEGSTAADIAKMYLSIHKGLDISQPKVEQKFIGRIQAQLSHMKTDGVVSNEKRPGPNGKEIMFYSLTGESRKKKRQTLSLKFGDKSADAQAA